MSENPPEHDFKRNRRERQNLVDLTRIDRLPPHSVETEQGLLGCCLLNPNEALGRCTEALEPESFYDLRHQAIYVILERMHNERRPIDLISVSERMKSANQLDAVGGTEYLAALQDATPSGYNFEYYIGVVAEKRRLRNVLATCSEAVSKIYEAGDGLSAQAVIDEAETAILKLNSDQKQTKLTPIKELVRTAVDRIQEYHNRQAPTIGLETGFPDLDKITGGLKDANVYVLAGRPSAGKTSLGMNIAEAIALRRNVPVGVFSLEMSADELAMRFLCSEGKLNGRALEEGMVSEGDFRRLTAAASKIANSSIHIDDTAGLTINQLRARARRMHVNLKCRAFVVDYLQLLKGTSRKAMDNRQNEIAEISSGIKALAKELKVPIVLLAQLNREMERDKHPRKPRLSDLRESGAIEQDADFVGLLYRPSEGEDDPSGNYYPVNLLVAKNRNGRKGEVELVFLASHTRFESASKIHP